MLAAGIDEAYIRPRGRVPVGTVPLANTRWRERIERSVATVALGFELELEVFARRVARSGWPIVETSTGRPYPVGTFDGLRVGWLAWYENGLEAIGPDWSLRPDGGLVSGDGRSITTAELVASLGRLTICDDRGPAEERRRYYEAEVARTREHALNALAFLDRQFAEGPPARRVASAD